MLFLAGSRKFEAVRQPQTLFLAANGRASQTLIVKLAMGASYRFRAYVAWRRDKLHFPILSFTARAGSRTGRVLASRIIGPNDVLSPAQGALVPIDVTFSPLRADAGERLVLDIRVVGGQGQANVDAISVTRVDTDVVDWATVGEPWDETVLESSTSTTSPTVTSEKEASTAATSTATTSEPLEATTEPAVVMPSTCVVASEYFLVPSALALPYVSFYPSRESWRTLEVRKHHRPGPLPLATRPCLNVILAHFSSLLSHS